MNYLPIELLFVSLIWIGAIFLTCKMAARERGALPRYATVRTEKRRD